jgi:transcriptional regulator with XRE-family HTH domain
MKIFQRRREQIGLSVNQVSDLSGISVEDLARFEATQGNARLFYDHVVVLARVLGIKPNELPGLRARDAKDPVREHVEQLERALRGGPRLTFEGQKGERFGGDVDRVLTAPSFAVSIGDSSLEPRFGKGALLGFCAESAPRPGDVVIVRHRKSKLLGLRRLNPPELKGLAAWQPAYVAGGEWIAVGQLQVVLPHG